MMREKRMQKIEQCPREMWNKIMHSITHAKGLSRKIERKKYQTNNDCKLLKFNGKHYSTHRRSSITFK